MYVCAKLTKSYPIQIVHNEGEQMPGISTGTVNRYISHYFGSIADRKPPNALIRNTAGHH